MGHSRFNISVSLVLLAFLFLPTVTADDPSSSCLAYAYTESESHAFLIQANTSNFGSKINVVTDCEYIELWIDGALVASSTGSRFQYAIDPGLHNVSLISNNFTANYSYVEFYPDRLNWEFEWIELNNLDVEFIDVTKAQIQENWASFLSIIIAWMLSTYVFWNLVQSYVQKNFIEEVTN